MKQLKCCLSLLLCLVLLAGHVPSALAGQAIGLSVTTPSSSSGKLKLSWDKAANVDYYAYSIRNLNTDELLADRKTTTRTYANVSGDWISGHTYRIWVGACCDGNNPDNTSTWDYTEQTTVTIYVCSHSDTDVAWDTDYSITYKSVSDTHHKMSGYMYTYCVDCYERVGDSYKTSEEYKHTFKSNGDCEVCNYTAGCSHDSTTLVEKSGYPVYKLDDEEEHIIDIQYKRVCRDCDEVLDSLVDDARDYYREDHTFNSKGVCKYCGFVKPEEQEPLAISVSNNQSSAIAGETISANAYASGGTGSYKYAWKVTCNGSVVNETDLGMGAYYTYSTSKAGTYVFTAYVRDSDGTQVSDSASSITVKEPACQHPATETAWSTQKSITYKSISDTQHSMSGYMGNYCTTCYEQVGDLYAMTKNYAHSFDDAGDCTVCDYKYSCKHTKTTYRLLSGFPAYKMVDEEKHTYTEKYEEVCANASCGKVVTMLADAKTVVERRAHNFNSKGICTDCGYQKVSDPLSIKVSRGQSSSDTGKNISASASASGGSGGYKYAWKVTHDGATVDETDLSMGSNYSYFAEKAGSYVFIAYVKDSEGTMVSASSSAITVEAAPCAHNNYKDVNGTPSYRTESDAKHIKVTPVRRVCSDCGKQINSWNKEKSEDHSFTDNRCTDCGLLTAGPCEHPKAYDDLIKSVISGMGTSQKHTLTRTYAVICPDCKETVRTYTKNASAEHSFNKDGVCSCGYAKPITHDHANKTEKALKDPVYENKDTDGHLKTTVIAVYCADCGTLLQQEKTQTVAESHKYANGVCACGHQEHVHTYQNRLTGKPSYTNLSLKIHEVTGACTPTCSACGATSAETNYTWTEKHNYTARGRIQAKHEDNGHATFNRCACGAVEYTGYAKYDNCCLCYGHKWEPSATAGHEKCTRCGEIRAVQTPAPTGTPAPETSQDDLAEERQYQKDSSIDFIEQSAEGKNLIYNQFFNNQLRSEISTLSEGTAARLYDFIGGDASASLLSTSQADYYVDTLMQQCAGMNGDGTSVSIKPDDFKLFCGFLGLEDAVIEKALEVWTVNRWTNKYGEMILTKKEFEKEMKKYEFDELEKVANGLDAISFLWECLYDYNVYSTAMDGNAQVVVESAQNLLQETPLAAAELASTYIDNCESTSGRIAYIILKNANVSDVLRDKAFDVVLSDPTLKLAYEGSTFFNDAIFSTTDMLESNHKTAWSIALVDRLQTELRLSLLTYRNNPSDENFNACISAYTVYVTYLISAYNGVLESLEVYDSSIAANIISDTMTDEEKARVKQWKMFMDWYGDDIEHVLNDHSLKAIDQLLKNME